MLMNETTYSGLLTHQTDYIPVYSYQLRMVWPTSISQIQKLPPVDVPEDTHAADPHNDEILDLLSNYTNGLPYVILTYRSIYLYDWTHKAPINVHVRSNESIEKFGVNVSVKLSPNQQTFAVLTDKNHILVYTIQLNNNNEILNIHAKNGDVLQNGYPVSRYQDDGIVYGGIDSKFTEGRNPESQGIVKNILNSFMSDDGNEVPIIDMSLRLKLVLNVKSPIVMFCFVSSMELMVINDAPHAFQILQLNSKNSTSDTDNVNFKVADQIDWFVDPEINNSSEIRGIDYNYDFDCFLWYNSQGDVLLVKHTGSGKDVKFTANVVYKAANKLGTKAVKVLINHFKNICYVLLQNSELLIYKLQDDFTCKLLKNLSRCLPAKNVSDIFLHPHGDSIVVLFENGWNVYSVLGNLNFSTFECDIPTISNVKKIQFLNGNQMVLINQSNEIVFVDLTCCNSVNGYNALSMKRPILFNNETISVFKAYEKKLIEHHHYNYNIDDVTNKETDVWLKEMMPVGFRLHNNIIRSCSVSDDGNNICIAGNYDVVIFNFITKKWKYTEIIQEDASFEKFESAIQKCIWWKNHLILGTYEKKNKESRVFVFSERILDPLEGFTVDSIVWSYDLRDSSFDEHFINFNIDLFSDTLFVFTNQLNCYTWNLKTKIVMKDKVSGDVESSLTQDTSLKSYKTYLTLQRSNVYQLKSCFKGKDDSIFMNFGTIMKVSDSDLLLLANTDLYYLKRGKSEYTCTLISSSVEYIQKLSPSLICAFDGCQLIHYNLNDNSNMLSLKPITINTGNDITIGSEFTTINYSGICLYPITTISSQNTMFGVEVECFNKIKLQLETNRNNYLSDLVDHYIWSNILVNNLEEDTNAMNIATVYGKFSVFKNFNFVLEKLMVDYLQKCYDDKKYDAEDEYFTRLYDLVILTGRFYEIVLNCLKKTETHFWPIFFTKSKENPRYIVNKLFTESEDQKLTAHFFIIMLNYEKMDTSFNPSKNKKNKKKGKNNRISTGDQDLIVNVLKKLIISHDFETSFELVRFLKIVDDNMTHRCLEKLKLYLKNV